MARTVQMPTTIAATQKTTTLEAPPRRWGRAGAMMVFTGSSLSCRPVGDRGVAVDAVESAGDGGGAGLIAAGLEADLVGHVGVAADAVFDDDLAARLVDLDGLVEVLEGEAFGVAVAVLGLDVVLADDRVVGDVAVVAGGAGGVG